MSEIGSHLTAPAIPLTTTDPFPFPTGPVHVAGAHLADALGEDYVAIAGTATAGTTTARG